MAWLKTLLAALVVVAGFTVQNVTIVYWTEASISNFGILILCGCSFFVMFGLGLLGFAIATGDYKALLPSDDPYQCSIFVSPWNRTGRFQLTQAQILLMVGLLNAGNGYGIVYASPPNRTPPLVQAILQNAAVLCAVPFSKLVLGDRKRYLAIEPLCAGLIVIGSVAVSLAPTFAQGGGNDEKFNGSSIAWIFVYIGGLAFGAAYNVMQQLFFIRSGALTPGISNRDAARFALRALFYANISQPLSMTAFLWLDLLPWFGTSTSGPSFSSNTRFSLACSIGGPSLSDAAGFPAAEGWVCPAKTPIWAWTFIGAYAFSYLGAAQLNRESATFNMLTFVVTTMTTAAFWLIPGTNPNPSATPLWSVMVSLCLSLLGSALWKRWENRTPAEEQFDVTPSSGGPEGGSKIGGYSLLAREVFGVGYDEQERDYEEVSGWT